MNTVVRLGEDQQVLSPPLSPSTLCSSSPFWSRACHNTRRIPGTCERVLCSGFVLRRARRQIYTPRWKKPCQFQGHIACFVVAPPRGNLWRPLCFSAREIPSALKFSTAFSICQSRRRGPWIWLGFSRGLPVFSRSLDTSHRVPWGREGDGRSPLTSRVGTQAQDEICYHSLTSHK